MKRKKVEPTRRICWCFYIYYLSTSNAGFSIIVLTCGGSFNIMIEDYFPSYALSLHNIILICIVSIYFMCTHFFVSLVTSKNQFVKRKKFQYAANIADFPSVQSQITNKRLQILFMKIISLFYGDYTITNQGMWHLYVRKIDLIAKLKQLELSSLFIITHHFVIL